MKELTIREKIIKVLEARAAASTDQRIARKLVHANGTWRTVLLAEQARRASK